MKLKYLYIIAFIVILSSCEKKDKAVILPPPGPSQVADIEMGANYENEIFFDIDSSHTFVQKNKSWELSFESNEKGSRVRLNGGILVKAANTRSTNWNATYTKNYIFYSDATNGDRDSTAVGNWADSIGVGGPPGPRSKNIVYIIDRGDSKPIPERYKKLKLIMVDDYQYKIIHANLDGSNERICLLHKNPSKNKIYFTFDNGGQVLQNFEPDANKWDFVFTSYAYIYHEYNPPLSYAVRGVLLNPRNVSSVADSTTKYELIDAAFAKNLKFTNQQDAIGFSWKTYDGTSGKYVVRSHVTYIIKSKKGYIYKLRFIDFYNNQGQKGYPKFEFQRL